MSNWITLLNPAKDNQDILKEAEWRLWEAQEGGAPQDSLDRLETSIEEYKSQRAELSRDKRRLDGWKTIIRRQMGRQPPAVFVRTIYPQRHPDACDGEQRVANVQQY